jgi:PIN domain-containing protein
VKRLLLDFNVVLDVLLGRAPHETTATAVWAAIEEGRASGLLAAHGFTTIEYLALSWPDFEDAVCAAAAEATIETRRGYSLGAA